MGAFNIDDEGKTRVLYLCMCVYMSMMKNNACIVYVHVCVGAYVCTGHSVCVCKDQGWCPPLPFNLFEIRSPYCSK